MNTNTKAAAYYDEKANRYRFESGSVIAGRKVGGRFATEEIFSGLLMGSLVTKTVAAARPEEGEARLAARLGRIARKGNPNQGSDGESLLRRAAWAA